MKDKRIDQGNCFDWGRVSQDYAKYRDIYPAEFYEKIYRLGIGTSGQEILDLGTGTGVIPRNLYHYGASFTGVDISQEQIAQAEKLSKEQKMKIDYMAAPAETLVFSPERFDAVTACQCFFYFQHDVLAPKLQEWLKPQGRLVLMYMAWLPYEDAIAGESEKLILKYNPSWSGCGEVRREIMIPPVYHDFFEVESSSVFDAHIPFTREGWEGRIRACRGVGASLEEEALRDFCKEHHCLLEAIAPESFQILHYCAVTMLKKSK